MIKSAADILLFLLQVIHPVRLVGPVLDKELRVSSRRKRTYLLRTLYLVLLMLVIIIFWAEEVAPRRSYSVIYQASRMSTAGLVITAIVIWFQFIIAQLVMGVSLSNAISDEVNHKTLGTLMTTPITSFQIVFGKLFSKLLIVLQLVAISFPMLGVIRVFGGVPWMFVLSSLYLTITAAIVVGSISLLWSIFCRRAYQSIIATVLTVGVLFGLSALFFALLVELFEWYKTVNEQSLFNIFFFTNPYVTYIVNTISFVDPSGTGKFVIHWFANGLIMLAFSLILLLLATVFVRRAALTQIAGSRSADVPKKKKRPKEALYSHKLRSVTGSPVLWKEMCLPLFSRHRKIIVLLIIASLGILFLSYLLLNADSPRNLRDEEVHFFYISVFVGLGVLFSLIIPATVISSEKESRSWMILLATPLTARQIVWAKFLGSLRRCFPAWSFLFLHMIIFVASGIIRPLALVQMPMIFLGTIAFCAATGVYFSHRFKHTTTAVIWNFSFAAAIWLVLPFVIAITSDVLRFRYIERLINQYMDTNPFVQAIVVIDGNIGSWTGHEWVGKHASDPTGLLATTWIFLVMLGYLLAAWFFIWLTSWRLRKHIE
jgi:ABC-type transport system involved in multi-copper enzyme maturation permease subunit